MVESVKSLVDPGVAVVLAAVSGVLGDSPGTFIFCKGKSCKLLFYAFLRYILPCLSTSPEHVSPHVLGAEVCTNTAWTVLLAMR